MKTTSVHCAVQVRHSTARHSIAHRSTAHRSTKQQSSHIYNTCHRQTYARAQRTREGHEKVPCAVATGLGTDGTNWGGVAEVCLGDDFGGRGLMHRQACNILGDLEGVLQNKWRKQFV